MRLDCGKMRLSACIFTTSLDTRISERSFYQLLVTRQISLCLSRKLWNDGCLKKQLLGPKGADSILTIQPFQSCKMKLKSTEILTCLNNYYSREEKNTTSTPHAMGVWTFCRNRIIDLMVPGAGMVLDCADAYELLEVCVLDFSVWCLWSVLRSSPTFIPCMPSLSRSRAHHVVNIML